MTHAILSPSSAERWINCPASVYFDVRLPDSTSAYAEEGTQAHTLAETILRTGLVPLEDYPADMLEDVMKYVLYVREAATGAVFCEVEQKLDLSRYVPESFGTADAIIITPIDGTEHYELHVIDLKFGRGVEVSAVENKQAMLYALGALDVASCIYDIKHVRITIHQPRIDNVSEWDISTEDLIAAGARFKAAGEHAIKFAHELIPAVTDFNPGETACKFCKAKDSCEALAAKVEEIVMCDFEDLTAHTDETLTAPLQSFDNERLGLIMANIGLVEIFTKAVRARVESELLRGAEVPGFKLVEGRRGSRRWVDDVLAEAALKATRLKADEMYNKKIISPTQADKLLKDYPRRWAKVKDLITADDGKPSVAPESDKRAALVINHKADFNDLTTTDTL